MIKLNTFKSTAKHFCQRFYSKSNVNQGTPVGETDSKIKDLNNSRPFQPENSNRFPNINMTKVSDANFISHSGQYKKIDPETYNIQADKRFTELFEIAKLPLEEIKDICNSRDGFDFHYPRVWEKKYFSHVEALLSQKVVLSIEKRKFFCEFSARSPLYENYNINALHVAVRVDWLTRAGNLELLERVKKENPNFLMQKSETFNFTPLEFAIHTRSSMEAIKFLLDAQKREFGFNCTEKENIINIAYKKFQQHFQEFRPSKERIVLEYIEKIWKVKCTSTNYDDR